MRRVLLNISSLKKKGVSLIMEVKITESPLSSKKYRVLFSNNTHVDIGASDFSDYTLHKDTARRENYIKRHQKREDWSMSGLYSAGFWARWLLWNQPTITQSIHDIKKRFNIKIIKKR